MARDPTGQFVRQRGAAVLVVKHLRRQCRAEVLTVGRIDRGSALFASGSIELAIRLGESSPELGGTAVDAVGVTETGRGGRGAGRRLRCGAGVDLLVEHPFEDDVGVGMLPKTEQ